MNIKEVKENFNKPPMEVRWKDLERSTLCSDYRSKCPICTGGVLLMQRNFETLELLAEDTCIVCGRRFIYTDLKDSGLV